MSGHNNPTSRAASLSRAAGIDLAMVLFGGGAIVLTFLTGQGVPRWHNLVFAPIVVILAAITARLVVAEVRELVPVLGETRHKGEAFAALGVAIAFGVMVVPMLAFMPFIFFAAL
jgi:hypothetical protein